MVDDKPATRWGVWDTWKEKWCGRFPFQSLADAEAYIGIGNKAEGSKRYEARELPSL
jgi:hypothetical protein